LTILPHLRFVRRIGSLSAWLPVRPTFGSGRQAAPCSIPADAAGGL